MSSPPVTVQAYVTALQQMGYRFRLNEAGDLIECNNAPLDDITLATIRAKMRAQGFTNGYAVEDVIKLEAGRNRYHPVKVYLTTCATLYDGQPHIEELASHFTDITEPHKCFSRWLRMWLIGAVAKVMDGEHHQNAMLVLDGPQGIGKSHFSQWLSRSLPEYFIESAVNPDNKDTWIRLASKWIWEVSELGATIRRADIEALKAFISQRVVTFRRPYARLDSVRPALASMIGTVNNSAGILADQTGNRRFLIANIKTIDWAYSAMNPDQIWGEAFNAYIAGERWTLTKDEKMQSEENNDAYRVPNVIEGYLDKYFYLNPDDVTVWTSTAEIVEWLQTVGYRAPNAKSVSMDVAATLGEWGFQKKKQTVNGKEKRIWGYFGIEKANGRPTP